MAGRRSPGRADHLTERVRAELAAGGVTPGDPVVVALSGGLDSTVLLHLLRFPLADLGLRLEAAHLDHAMRPGSDADARWVRGLCRAWNVPVRHARLRPPGRSEADARTRRYAFLSDATPSDGWLLTAHHRDDQAETVLFRVIRGTGIRGLRGIAPRKGRILRPLLSVDREALETYAAANGVRHRVDPTNRDLRYARNRLRHEVLPLLEAARPGAARALARLADRARRQERALESALASIEDELVVTADTRAATLARPVLLAYDPALRARALRRILRRYGSTPGRAGTHAALEFISSGPSGGELHVAGNVRLERDFDRIRVVRGEAAEAEDRGGDEALMLPDPGPGRGRARIGGKCWEVAWGVEPAGDAPETVRLEDPVYPLRVRGWEPGDRIRLAYGTKKLKKLFAERRLDRRARRRVPVVVDGKGRVLWVVGLARAEAAEGSRNTLEITVRDAEQQ